MTSGPQALRRRVRRTHLAALVVAVLVVAGVLSGQFWRNEHATYPLYQVTVVRESDGGLVALPRERWEAERADLIGSSRVLPPPGSASDEAVSLGLGTGTARATADWLWLRRGDLPGEGTAYEEMARRALLDLRALTGPEGAEPGAVLAAGSRGWDYVWPRDAAFVAVAYARTGHRQESLDVLQFVQRQQAADGSMHARYLPDGSGPVPDGRGLQEDGPGWSLWAAREVLEAEAPATRRSVATTLTPLVTRSTARILGQLDPVTGLPLPSPDYWEVPERRLTLGIAATSLAGLEAAAELDAAGLIDPAAWAEVGVDPSSLDRRAADLRVAVEAAFGPEFPRHAGGRPDAAVTFLLPPFTRCPLPGADAARLAALPEMERPAGGVAPGAGWRRDGISWTPQTALQALASAATGDRASALAWLDWLDAHRTEAGSLPEKVLFDGQPAAVAPLAWTSALVLISLDELASPSATPRPDASCGGPGPRPSA
ncbi:glycoside hydrolase family 15 [Ornithinicoccus hortensis]|uniref:GH15 family glucan-1,4-alpha-glucosidase n=1 Tax=Ornithinicoccus hortensis TaxID=82346 RepID=A0A542YW96_9MICO|nr:glycoside hydrolase family 15 [Ornithinicoccus hortensis]TQL52347.1 hypothetical protein FB467_3528 [Ornithinicoccus hortensis]